MAAVLAQLKESIPCAASRIPGNIRERMFSPRDRASSAFIKILFMTELCQGKYHSWSIQLQIEYPLKF